MIEKGSDVLGRVSVPKKQKRREFLQDQAGVSEGTKTYPN
jgi:hypothetical protein